MVINKSQRMMLEYLKSIKDTGPNFLQMYKQCWKCSLALVMIVILLIVTDFIFGFSIQSLFFYGAVFGAMLRDHGIKRRQKINWPIQRGIINWKQVDVLLAKK